MSARSFSILLIVLLLLPALAQSDDVPDPDRLRVQQEIEDISTMSGSDRRLYFRVRRKLDSDDRPAALALLRDHFKTAKPERKTSPLLHYEFGRLLAENDETDEARSRYLAATRLEPRFAKAWLASADLAYRDGDFLAAATGFETAYRLGPTDDPRYLYYAAVAAAAADDHARALALYDELYFKTGREPREDWCRALVASAIVVGDSIIAEAALDHLLDAQPASTAAWELSYTYYASVGDLEQAATSLRILGYLRPLSAEENLNLGDLLFSVDAPARAAEHYRAAVDSLAADPEKKSAGLEKLGSALMAAGRSDLALPALLAYAETLERSARTARTDLLIGYSAFEAGRMDLALKYLQEIAADSLYGETASRLLEYMDLRD